MKKLLVLLFLISGSLNLKAQFIKNSYIVDLKDMSTESFEAGQGLRVSSQKLEFKVLSSTLNIVQITTQQEEDQELEKWLNNNPNVESWGYNCYVQKRETPNDQYFDMQWGLDIINARDAGPLFFSASLARMNFSIRPDSRRRENRG